MPPHTSRLVRCALAVLPTLGVLATAGAPAHAQAPATSVRATIAGAPSTIQAGDAFTLRSTVTNSGATTARAPRYFVGLTRGSRPVSSFKRLVTRNLPALRAGRRLATSVRIRVAPDSSGSYSFVLCTTQTGRRVRCVLGPKLVVTKIPRPAPAPTPAPAPVPAPPVAPQPPVEQRLRSAISAQALTEHTDALAVIGLRTGNRAARTQGYDDSATYVINRLVKAGYEPRIDRFEYTTYALDTPPTLTTSIRQDYVRDTDFTDLEYSGSGDTGADTPIVPIDLGPTPTPDTAPNSSNSSGCEAADFAGFAEGSIALVKRGTCTFAAKAQNAVDAGASGVIVFNEGQPGREEILAGTLGDAIEGGAEVPVVGTTALVGEQLAATSNPTGRITIETTIAPGSSYNVLADTPTGDPAKTVVVGAHLDSVVEGAGVNDNGSGSAFNLELAEKMSALGVKPVNRVRFAWWGAEESGLVGSTAYVAELSDAEFGQIGLNLNFDMLGSPNFARLIYDGDFSDSPKPVGITALAPGSADVETAFRAAFDAQGLSSLPTGFDGRSDYKPFQDNGVPAGGLFSGAEDVKTVAEAGLFGGTAGLEFDPNYHEAGDDGANLDLVGFEQMSDAAGQVSLQYANAPVLPAKFAPARAARRGAAQSGRRDSSGGEWLGGRLQR